MVYKSLISDFFYEDSGVTSLSYYVTCSGETIYTGKAYNPKGIKINIRKIVEDWLWNDMPDFREFDGVLVEHPEAMRVFGLYTDEGTQLEEYEVLLSHEEYYGSSMEISKPINAHADPRQKIFLNNVQSGETEEDITSAVTYFHVVPNYYYASFDSNEYVCLGVSTNADISKILFQVISTGGTIATGFTLSEDTFCFQTSPNPYSADPRSQQVVFYYKGEVVEIVSIVQDFDVPDHFGADDYNVGILGCNEYAYVTYDGRESKALKGGKAAYFAVRVDPNAPELDLRKTNIGIMARNNSGPLTGNYTDLESEGVYYGHMNTYHSGCTQGLFGDTNSQSIYGNIFPPLVSSGDGYTVEYLWFGAVDCYVQLLPFTDRPTTSSPGSDKYCMPNLKEVVFVGDPPSSLTYMNSMVFSGSFLTGSNTIERLVMPDYTYPGQHTVGSFRECPNLRYIRLAPSITDITGSLPFEGCESLHTIIGPGLVNVPTIYDDTAIQKLYMGGVTVEEFKKVVPDIEMESSKYKGIGQSLRNLKGSYLKYVIVRDGAIKLKYDEEGNASLDE